MTVYRGRNITGFAKPAVPYVTSVQSAYETAVPGPCSGPMCCSGNSLVTLNHAAPTYDCYAVTMGAIPQYMAGVSNISARPVHLKPIRRRVCPKQDAGLKSRAAALSAFIRGARVALDPSARRCHSSLPCGPLLTSALTGIDFAKGWGWCAGTSKNLPGPGPLLQVNVAQQPSGFSNTVYSTPWAWWQAGDPANSGLDDASIIISGPVSAMVYIDGQLPKLASSTGLNSPTVNGAYRWCQTRQPANITTDQGKAPEQQAQVQAGLSLQPCRLAVRGQPYAESEFPHMYWLFQGLRCPQRSFCHRTPQAACSGTAITWCASPALPATWLGRQYLDVQTKALKRKQSPGCQC